MKSRGSAARRALKLRFVDGGDTGPKPAAHAEIVLFVDRAKERADFRVGGQAQAVVEILIADAEGRRPNSATGTGFLMS